MPELPEVETIRRRIAPALVSTRIAAVELYRRDLRAPFPPRFVQRLTGQTIVALNRRAKFLLAAVSSGETLLMHLGMSGWFRVVRRGMPVHRAAHDHVVFRMASGRSVVFNDPRRFGVMDLIRPGELDRHPALSRLGPEPLSDAFDARALARACRGRKTSLKSALLDQRVVAGLGNIYAAEALHAAGLSPFRRASTIATRSGAPRDAAGRLTGAIKQVLHEAIGRQASYGAAAGDPFRVYDREGQPCARARCRGVIRRRTQAGRSTFSCPVCQR